jgi:hypothetical protein
MRFFGIEVMVEYELGFIPLGLFLRTRN